MSADTTNPQELVAASRPTELIAQALVERLNSRQVTARCAALGLSRQMVRIVLAATGNSQPTSISHG